MPDVESGKEELSLPGHAPSCAPQGRLARCKMSTCQGFEVTWTCCNFPEPKMEEQSLESSTACRTLPYGQQVVRKCVGMIINKSASSREPNTKCVSCPSPARGPQNRYRE